MLMWLARKETVTVNLGTPITDIDKTSEILM